MLNMTLESKLERAFQDDVIFRYPEGTSMNQLKHKFLAERKNAKGKTVSSEGFYKVKQELVELDKDVMQWHRNQYGTELNKFDASPEANERKDQYRNDHRFKKAFEFFGVDWEQHNSKIYLPWWAEVLASQVSHEQLSDGSYQATFAPMHPFELQLVKRGLDLPVKSTSTLGVLITVPDAQSRGGYVVLGVRTGAGHANTYHVVPAGYLQASKKFMRGDSNIYEGFVEDELTPESGLGLSDLSEIRPLAIVHDHIISNGGPEYVFLMHAKLTKEEVRNCWRTHDSTKDKHEYAEFVFVPAAKDSVKEFLARNYVGAVKNKPDRKDNERYILNPAALALASYSGMSLSELKSYCNGKDN